MRMSMCSRSTPLLARLSDRPVTLLTLQAAKVLEGMLQRGFTTVRDAAGRRWRPRRSGRGGLVRRPAHFPLGHGAEPDRRARRHPAAHPAGRELRLLRGRPRAVAHRRRRRGVPPRRARRAAQGRDADQDRRLGRRRLALRPDLEPAIQRRRGARDRRGGAGLAHLCDGARLFARGDPPLDRFRGALDRARQSDRPRHRRARRRRRRLCRADARHL